MEEKALRRNDDLIAQVKDYHARQASSQRSSPSGTPRASPSRLSRGSRDDSPPLRRVGRHSLPGLGTGGSSAFCIALLCVLRLQLGCSIRRALSSGLDEQWSGRLLDGEDGNLVDVLGGKLDNEEGLSATLQTHQQYGGWRDSKEAARLFSPELAELSLPPPKLTVREAALHAKAAEVFCFSRMSLSVWWLSMSGSCAKLSSNSICLPLPATQWTRCFTGAGTAGKSCCS